MMPPELSTPPHSNQNLWALVMLGLGLGFGILAGLVVFFGIPGLPNLPQAGSGPTGTPAPAPVVGAPAPDFTLKDLQTAETTLSQLQGQVVLINFWATWCEPCRIEMPALQRRYEAHKDQGLVVLAVNVDEPEPLVSRFVEAYALTFPVLLDPGGTVTDLYRVRGFPTTLFVGRDGVIAQMHIGSLTEGQLDDYLAKLGFGN